MNGFVNVAPGQNRSASVVTPVILNPEHADQFEVGTKLNVFKDRLYATFSYYNTEVKDQVYTVYTATTQTSYQDGGQKRGHKWTSYCKKEQNLNL